MTLLHTHRVGRRRPTSRRKLISSTAAATAVLIVGIVMAATPAYAAGPGLGTAAAYSVLGGSTVTNTGSSVLSGDLGVSPGTATTGFTTATIGGATHAGDAQAAQAQSDLTAAYTTTAGLTPTQTSLGSSLVGGVHGPGVYNAASALGLSGAVTLDGQGNPNSVFVFQVGAGFTTASSSSILLIGDAQACNVFWQIGSSATLGTNTTFVGTIMALTSISLNTGATVQGRALARNGAVTLDDNVFTAPSCATVPTAPTTSASSTTASSAPSGTSTAPASATPTGHPKSTPGASAASAAAAAASAAAAARARTALGLAGNTGAGGAAGSTSTTLLAATGVSTLGLVLASAALLALGGVLLRIGFGHLRPRRTPPAHRA